MIHLLVNDDVEQLWSRLEVPSEALEDAASVTLSKTQASEESELTIVLGSDELLREQNLEFLKIDATTDVLSFNANFTDPDSQAEYLGDIIISIPRAIAQAELAGHSALYELQLLVAHGVLHLLGFDHSAEDDKQAMQKAQDSVLNELGNPYGPRL